MGKQRMINTDFWNDTFVVDHLTLTERYLYIYLFTNPHTNAAGVYELSLRIMGFETGIESEHLANMLKRLEPKVYYKNGWVVMRNGIKNQNYRNVKMNTAILSILETVPSDLLQHLSWPKDFGNPKPKGTNQTQLIDDSYMTNEGSLHSNSNNNSNYNSNAAAAVPSAGDSKLSKTQKRSYAKAVQADKALAEKEAGARGRQPGNGLQSAREVAEQIKRRKK